MTSQGYCAAVQGILRHLELADNVSIPEPRTHRQADDLTEEWVERFFADIAELGKNRR